jgi:hypothetical protein
MLNVGDLKPMEYPITLFMDMAWNPTRYTADNLLGHTRQFCAEQLGEEQADEAARILNLVGKYNGRRTAEMLDADTYNVETGEWRQVADDYMRLEAEALRQYLTLKPQYRDAYQELILFPVQAMSNLHQMYYAQAMNRLMWKRNLPEANLWADRVAEAFGRDSLLCRAYNRDIAGGKWNGMMTQKHIGYTSWNDDFPADRMPEVHRVADTREGGYVYEAKDSVVVMDAERYYAAQAPVGTRWTVIPYLGRGRSAMTLMPQTAATGGAALDYRFKMGSLTPREVKVYVMVKSTLDFLNQGGLRYEVSIDGAPAQTVNFNARLNEAKENIYSIYYPTVASRAVVSSVTLPLGAAASGVHTLTLRPLDPAIVFEKILVDAGGYKPTYLLMDESPCARQ